MTCFRMQNGETLRQYCLKNDICYSAIYGRLEKGMTPEAAIAEYLPHKGRKDQSAKYFINGKKLGEYTGGTKTKLYGRILKLMYNQKLSPKEALIVVGLL